jgi:hypothetical protein
MHIVLQPIQFFFFLKEGYVKFSMSETIITMSQSTKMVCFACIEYSR